VGLTHSLKNLIWFNNIDVDTFYPRCFDMGLTEDMDDFIQEFKATKAQGYAKIYVRELREQFESGAA
jgi:tubulin monoglycylase TTLL3/8